MKCLDGDLNQMYTQMDFLRQKGISVRTDGGMPILEAKDYEQSLRLIYSYGIIGWWNYKEDLVSLGICTEEQFVDRLKD